MTSLATSLESVAHRVGSLWWALVAVGIGWIVLGFVVLRFDNSTVEIVSIVFGVMILLAGLGELFRASVSIGGWRVWHVVFGILLVIGSIVAFTNPGGTFVSLGWVVGFYFVVAGVFDIIFSLMSIAFPGWWIGLLAGTAELILGFIASSSFADSAVVLVTFVSVLAIFRGVSEITAGFATRAVAKSIQ